MKNIRRSILITLFCLSSFITFAQTITSIALIGKAENYKSWDYPSEPSTLQSDIIVDRDNNIIYCDRIHHQVKKIDRITGVRSVVAGIGTPGFSGDGGLAVNAQIEFPISLALDRLGNLYISDRDNHRVRKIEKSTQIISTIVGDGIDDFKGDGGLAKNASLNFPMGICIDTNNNMLLIADTYNYVIRRVNLSTNIIQTIAGQAKVQGYAGDGSSAFWTSRFKLPTDVEVDKQGNVYINDLSDSRIRKITTSTGIINTIIGGNHSGYRYDTVSALSAGLAQPLSITIDKDANLYIAEVQHNRIRKFDVINNKLYLITGNSQPGGHYGDGGPAKDAGIKFPSGVFYNSLSNELFFADNDNYKIRLISNTPEAPSGPIFQEVCRLTESATPRALGTNLLWYNNPIGGTGSSVPPLINTSEIDTFTYFVSQTIAGKESVRKAITVATINYDSAYFYFPTYEICNKSHEYLALNHFVPVDFSEYVHFSTNPFFTDTFGYDPDNLLYSSRFTIYAKTISYKGCQSPTFSTEIIVKEQVPIPKFDPIINVCQWDHLDSLKAEGQDIRWYNDTLTGWSLSSPRPSTGSVYTNYFYLNQTDSLGCTSDFGILKFTVNPKPKEYAQVKSPVEYCQGDVAEKFFAIGSNLSWFNADSIFLGNETPRPSTKEAGETKTLVCVQNEYGCKGIISTITTKIKPKPSINTAFEQSKPFAGLPITLNCSSDIGKTFMWNTGDTQPSLIYTPKNEGRHYFWVQSTSELGCKSDTLWHYVDITPSKYWDSDYEVYPNPFVNRIYLSNINLNDIMSVNLYSLNGIKVFQSEMPLKSLEINIPDWLLGGMYLLEVNTVGRANPTRLVYKK